MKASGTIQAGAILAMLTAPLIGGCLSGGTTPNLPPVAQLHIALPIPEAPGTVILDGSTSYDTDGRIVKYEFDFDGDGIYDYAEIAVSAPDGKFDGKTIHTYAQMLPCSVVGSPSVRVTDDRGATASDWMEQEIFSSIAGCNRFPVATLEASVTGGAAPLAVNFDGSISYDPDDELPHFPGQGITLFEWDFDYPGSPNLFSTDDTGARPHHTYAAPGTYIAALKVTDNEGDQTLASITITVTP